jgi:hypothetical protein
LRQAFPNTAQGHRKLVAWLRKYQVGKAVMEASGGYEIIESVPSLAQATSAIARATGGFARSLAKERRAADCGDEGDTAIGRGLALPHHIAQTVPGSLNVRC